MTGDFLALKVTLKSFNTFLFNFAETQFTKLINFNTKHKAKITGNISLRFVKLLLTLSKLMAKNTEHKHKNVDIKEQGSELRPRR